MKSPNIRYIPAIDHLRGLAALLIVYYHGLQLFRPHMRKLLHVPDAGEWIRSKHPLVSLVAEGHTAVGFFMVLSGFIFTFGSLNREIEYGRFLKNRILRIYPLFVFALVVAAYATQGGYTFVGFLQTLLFQSNLPGAFAASEFVGVTWAISVEFQFYLIFPFLIRFVGKYGARYLFGLLAVVWAYRFMAQLGTTSVRDLSYWTIVGRMDHFIIGILAGVLYVKCPRWVRTFRFTLPLGVAAVLGLLSWFNQHGGYPDAKPMVWFFWPSLEGTAWAVFSLCYLGAASWLPRFISRILAYIGELSFSIYVTHFLIISVLCRKEWFFLPARDAQAAALIYTTIVAVPIILAVSSLTYFTIEKPFLELRKSYLAKSTAS